MKPSYQQKINNYKRLIRNLRLNNKKEVGDSKWGNSSQSKS